MTIYALLIPAFFPPAMRGWVLWGLYLAGIIVAIGVARLLRKTVFRGESAPFVMELPPYRMPTWRSVGIHMWDRSWSYLQKAGTVILALSIVLWALGTFPRRTEFSKNYDLLIAGADAQTIEALEAERKTEQLEHTAAGRLGKWMEPAIQPLGFDWRVGTALIGAFAAKEVFVAQMGIVFSLGSGGEGEPDGLRKALRDHYSPLQGLSMMLFCLLSAPCLATIAVAKREMDSWGWAMAMLAGMTLVAWTTTFMVYRAGLWFGLGGI